MFHRIKANTMTNIQLIDGKRYVMLDVIRHNEV